MAVITVSGEFGSEGTYVAKLVAQALNYHFVGKDVMGLVFDEYGFSDFASVYETEPGFMASWDDRRTEILKMLDKVNRALARHGNLVILEGGAFAVLSGLSDVLNVRIQASLPARVQWAMDHHDFSDRAKAEAFVGERDKARADFVEFSYKVRWDSVRAFDLVVDTDKLSPDLVVKWVTEAHQALLVPKKNPLGQKATKAIEVDSILADTVATALKCKAAH
jgi:cytidylate kinase